MHLSNPWWHFRSDLPKSEIFNIGGVHNMFENKFYWYRSGNIKKTLSTFFIRHIIFWPFFFFITFSNIFLNILMPLFRVYFGRPRNVGIRVGAYSIRPGKPKGCFAQLPMCWNPSQVCNGSHLHEGRAKIKTIIVWCFICSLYCVCLECVYSE